RPECLTHPHEEASLLSSGGHPDALERAVQPDIGVQVAVIFVEMKERTGTPREIAALALPQLCKLAQPRQQLLQTIKITLCRVPPPPSMPAPRRVTQDLRTAPPPRARKQSPWPRP